MELSAAAVVYAPVTDERHTQVRRSRPNILQGWLEAALTGGTD